MAMVSAAIGMANVWFFIYEWVSDRFYKEYARSIQWNRLALDAVLTGLDIGITFYDVYVNWAVYHIYSYYDWYLIIELNLHLVNAVFLVALLGLMVFIERVQSGDLW